MFSIIWRLVAMLCLMPFCIIPIVGWPFIPVQIYLVISLAAHVWRRVNPPAAPPPEKPSSGTTDFGLKLR